MTWDNPRRQAIYRRHMRLSQVWTYDDRWQNWSIIGCYRWGCRRWPR